MCTMQNQPPKPASCHLSRQIAFPSFNTIRFAASPLLTLLLPQVFLAQPHPASSRSAVAANPFGGLAMKQRKTKADATKKADSKLAVRKGSERASKMPKMTKAKKDPNKPKRPPSAFFVFMEGFRKTFKEQHPNNKSVSVVGKAGGDKWKSLSEGDKAPFVDKAAKLKKEYTKKLATYNTNQAEGVSRPIDIADEDQSDKSKSEDGEGSDEEVDEDDE
ncbi:HMG1/2-like protein [Zingiber officinale]|uniref:HMG1/2-like protein n=1 Tax=Zingiber officinale TaxID=94328 RepID=UPI001C4C12DD|nr:HMG1/2-like protein [Zingiber officinale]